MEVGYYAGNRERLYKKLCPGELLAIFSGEDVSKPETNAIRFLPSAILYT